ncbi:MAG: tetratricopeptide repeat protein [Pirellulaceae bacterium]
MIETESRLVKLFTAAGRTDEVETHYRQALLLWEKLAAQSSAPFEFRYALARTYRLLSNFLAANQRYEEAEEASHEAVRLLEETLKLPKAKLPSDHAKLFTVMRELANGYYNAKDFPRWEAISRDILAVQRKNLVPEHLSIAESLAHLGRNLLIQKRHTEAEPLLRECLAIREKTTLPDGWGWLRFHAESLLGGSLLGQGRYAEAEPHLVHGYQGMKQSDRQAHGPNKGHLIQALERLVQLYDSWGKQEEADKWRKELQDHEEARAGI